MVTGGDGAMTPRILLVADTERDRRIAERFVFGLEQVGVAAVVRTAVERDTLGFEAIVGIGVQAFAEVRRARKRDTSLRDAVLVTDWPPPTAPAVDRRRRGTVTLTTATRCSPHRAWSAESSSACTGASRPSSRLRCSRVRRQ